MVSIAGLETARRQLRRPAMFGVALVNPPAVSSTRISDRCRLRPAVLIDFGYCPCRRRAVCGVRGSSSGGVGQRWATVRRESRFGFKLLQSEGAALWHFQRYAKKSQGRGFGDAMPTA